MIRISMYFHLYMMILIPIAINKTFTGFNRYVVYSVLIVILLALSLKDGSLGYKFYWDEPYLMDSLK